jgi:GH43 family beta-xylosidase
MSDPLVSPFPAIGAPDSAVGDCGRAYDAAGGSSDLFVNPIAPGADPWVVFHEGFYYWCFSEGDAAVAVYRSERLTERGERVIVWRAPANGPHSQQVWAPELHRLDGRWYIYLAASNGRNETHRMIVLESVGDEPTSEFRFKAELYTGDNIESGARSRWAIDGTVLEHRGQRYMLWSGWQNERDEQWLYIATLSNPWTVSSNRVRLCANDDFAWECIDETLETRGLNEAPQVLQRDGRVFVVYSASASWKTTYKLGMLVLAPTGDPMDPLAWAKFTEPVLAPTTSTWGVGHCGFTRSPDGTEDWIVFHAKLERRANWNRAVHAQRFTWKSNGTPVFGAPVGADVPIAVPSGQNIPQETSVASVALGRAALAAMIGEDPMITEVNVTGVSSSTGMGAGNYTPDVTVP